VAGSRWIWSSTCQSPSISPGKSSAYLVHPAKTTTTSTLNQTMMQHSNNAPISISQSKKKFYSLFLTFYSETTTKMVTLTVMLFTTVSQWHAPAS
jgi:hypothetical protein